MKHMLLVFILISILFYPPFIRAEYYQWSDRNGTKHFTDNFSEVPENQRPSVNIYKSILRFEKKTDAKEKQITADELVIKQDALEREYQELMKKRKKLTQDKKQLDQKEYNKLAEALNIEINQYQEKIDAYERLVEKYNAQISARTSNKNQNGSSSQDEN